jgi:uncharacterized membrane protein YidH (DUF202 family)
MSEDALFDPALQLERTHLAWSRTALAFLGNAALVARLSRHAHPIWLALAVAVGLAVIGAWAWWHGRSAYPVRAAALRHSRPPEEPGVMRTLATTTTVVVVAAAAVALTTLAGG